MQNKYPKQAKEMIDKQYLDWSNSLNRKGSLKPPFFFLFFFFFFFFLSSRQLWGFAGLIKTQQKRTLISSDLVYYQIGLKIWLQVEERQWESISPGCISNFSPVSTFRKLYKMIWTMCRPPTQSRLLLYGSSSAVNCNRPPPTFMHLFGSGFNFGFSV